MAKLTVDDVLRLDAAGTPHPAPSAQARRMNPLAEEVAARPYRPSWSPSVLAGVVGLMEFVLILGIGMIVRALYLGDTLLPDLIYTAVLVGASTATVVGFQAMGAYDLATLRAPFAFMLRLTAAWTAVYVLTLALSFLAKLGGDLSRVIFAVWYVSVLVALAAERVVVGVVVRRILRAGRLDRRTAIVGGGPSAEALLRALDAQRDSEVRVCGVFDDRDEVRSPDMVAGYPKLGTTEDLVEFVRRTHLDLVIFTLPITAEERILEMLRKLWVLPVDIRLSAHQSKLRLRPRSYSYIGSVPVLDVTDRPIADWDIVLKALFDKIVGAILLVLLSPVMLLTALAVKLDSPGPVFFRQRRYGFNNEMIEVWKFRSMYTHMTDPTASKLATKDDPRVTRVGRIIRKTSLDELPQLFNVVFAGNLSLVGPRPHAVNASAENRRYDDIIDGYFARHKVKPGITGWAQVRGWRGETDTLEKIQRRVEHDLYYIENWSVFFDLYILLMTPFALAKTENAY